ncbi:MAG: hypothetical protein PWP31_418 [Clostridia bacterium]|nr:hypothetical protein [Clostridia bacterium]
MKAWGGNQMAKIQLVALDLDGTLLTDEIVIDKKAKEAIRKVREKGINVTLATGRMFSSAQSFAVELGIELPMIVYHGAQVRHPITGEVFFERGLPLSLAECIIRHIRHYGYAYNVYLDDKLYVENIKKENIEYVERTGVKLYKVDDMLDFLKKGPLKIVALQEGDKLDLLEEDIKRDVGDKVYITRSLPFYLETLNREANKARGLKALAEMEGFKAEEIMVFGDSYNDIEMFKYAGISIAMGNAPETVKAYADYVTGTNNEGGVAKALEKFILGG